MSIIARNNDLVGTGRIVATVLTVKAHGEPVATVGDMVTSHGDDAHAAAFLLPGPGKSSSTVLAGKRFICRIGDEASCGHKITPAPGVTAKVNVGN